MPRSLSKRGSAPAASCAAPPKRPRRCRLASGFWAWRCSASPRARTTGPIIFAPLAPEVQQAFEDRFGAQCLGEMYGQTECAAVAMSSVVGARKRDTHGRVLPDMEVRAMSETGEFLPAGELGELVVRALAPGVFFSGYWK
ncbi:MAG: AMP-binding protein, partial [Sphingopyxis sp.]